MFSLKVPPNSTSEQKQSISTVLIVEDEDAIRDIVVHHLQQEGYTILEAKNGREALSLLTQTGENFIPHNIDLIILDLMLPGINGLDICRLLRHQGNMIPILIISARDKEEERVLGLEVGADDYLIKPFGVRELIARCHALLRRNSLNSPSTQTKNCRQFKDIVLFPQECRVTVREQEVSLSPKEFKLLELFMSSPRRVWDREQLIENIWGADFMGDTKTVDVHVRWLRQKLEKDPSNPEYLITVRGFGYRFG